MEDFGTELADAQADDEYFAENNMCPDCETKYNKDGHCRCEED